MSLRNRAVSHRAVLLAACCLVGMAPFVGAQNVETNRKRWAIIPTTADADALADLLTVELSQWEQVELLERDRIRSVLAELQISANGLTTPAQTLRFGNVGQADALALIDVPSDDIVNSTETTTNQKLSAKTNALRLRLVDTRTSVRLLDALLPVKDLESSVSDIRDQLKSANLTLDVPLEKLRLIGVIPIKSAEPGRFLDPFCRTLTTLVEVELHRIPEFIVVERSELQRLTQEAETSGLPLAIRAATRLIETSVRRADDGRGMQVTCRLLSPGSGSTDTFELIVESPDVAEVRRQFITKLSTVLGNDSPINSLSLEAEALVFDRRNELFRQNRRTLDALEMAEVSLALSPNRERLADTMRGLRDLAEKSENWQDRFEFGYRHQILRLAQLRRTRLQDPLRDTIGYGGVYGPKIKLPSTIRRQRSALEQQKADEWFEIGNQIFDHMYAESPEPGSRFRLLTEKLNQLSAMHTNPEDYIAALAALNAQMQQVVSSIRVPEMWQDVKYVKYVLLLTSVVDVVESRSLVERHRSSRLPALRPFRINLGDDDALGVGIAELYRRAYHSRDLDAILSLLSLIDDWQPWTSPRVSSFVDGYNRDRDVLSQRHHAAIMIMLRLRRIREQLLARCPRDTLQRYFDDLISDVLETQNAEKLLQIATSLHSLFARMPPDLAGNIAVRVATALDDVAAADRSQEAMYIRGFAKRYSASPVPVSRPAFAKRRGPWQKYVQRPIKLTNVAGENYDLQSVHVDRTANAQRRGGELILVFKRRFSNLSIERVSLSGGTPQKVGPDIPGSPISFRGVQIAASPDAVFVASDAPGITMLREDSFEVFDQIRGAPSNDVWSMTWYQDRLYVGFRDSIASFDPVSKSFQLLASGTSFEPKNELDGRGGFFPRLLLADEQNECLWISIQDNAVPATRDETRNGFWKYQPALDKYTRFTRFPMTPYPAGDRVLMYVRGGSERVFLADGASAEPRFLKEYAVAHSNSGSSGALVMMDDHIISEKGDLFTPDGSRYQIDTGDKWSWLQATSTGFITHYDKKTKTLWSIERRR